MNLENIVKIKIELAKAVEGKKKIELESPCWEGYEQIGTKELDGKTVPNCVPVKASKVKEGFPIPSVDGEDEDKYISRCISAIVDEYPAEGQAYAVCKAKYDEK